MILGDLLKETEIVETFADINIEIHGVCYDTRKLRAGELFVAIRGFEYDGHKYISEAVEKGAVCILCEQAPTIKAPYILVKDSRKTLATLSAAWFGYPASRLTLIGVTGTNGKTTVTTLVKQVIEMCTGAKVGLIGTNIYMIGDKELHAERTTPESYEIQELLDKMVCEGCRYAVMEVSSHALCLHRVYGIEFEVGVYTNLSQDHLDFHSSIEEYAQAKSILFENCRSAAINIDDEYAPLMIAASTGPTLTYAVTNVAADLVGKSIKLLTDRVEFCALSIGSLNRVEIPIPGMFSVYNALAVIAAAMMLGFDIERIAAVMQTCAGVKGRAEVVPTGRDYTVLIDYAHTPDALQNIITTARSLTSDRIVTLFGCGGDRDNKKRRLMGSIAARFSDYVVVTSDNPRTEEPGSIINEILTGLGETKTPHKVIENRREAIHWVLENALPGDVIILAGKGHETYQIFGKEKIHFDEREVIAEYYNEIAEEE